MRRLGLLVGTFSLVLTLSPAVTPMTVGAGSEFQSNDARVNAGSPTSPFPRNKQNEPGNGVVFDSHDPSVLVAGANEQIDNAPCKTNKCGFTPGVSDNGIYFSFDAAQTWIQPTYSGWSARGGTAKVGPIGTVPWYHESGLVGDGDPAMAFGPRPGSHGFSWNNGSRLYYSSLASNFPGARTLPDGAEAITVSRTDDVRASANGTKNAWMRPVVASRKLQPGTFSDKEEIWADNAATSSDFGNVYLCWVSFGATSAPLVFARSTDGGSSWSNPLTLFDTPPTATSGSTSCTIRTDSKGTVYVLWEQVNIPNLSHEMMSRSFDGGRTFESPRSVANVVEVGKDDPVHTANGDSRWTFDGVAGARTGSGLQVDIANGAPSGQDATDQAVMTWSDARHGLNHEEALVQSSSDRGAHWTAPVAAQAPDDRPDFAAIAISPNGKSVFLTYDAFRAPWQTTTSTPRPMQGVVRTARVDGAGELSGFTTVHRGKLGDARGSSENNLCCEFLGDYNYVVATRDFGAAVWNDVRDAQVCDAMNRFRQSLMTSKPLPKPSPATDCPPRFGNTDIFGGTYTPAA